MNKKVYADYHGPRFTRAHDGEFAQWQYSGIARKSKVVDRSCNYNPDLIEDTGLNNIATMSYPMVGMQSQHDVDYIEYQILLAKIAKIDGFFVEWGFREHKSNAELKLMLEVAQKYDFEIGINWCDAWHFYDWIEVFYPEAKTRQQKLELFKQNVQYLIDEVFSYKYAAKFDKHPIILLFGGGLTSEEFKEIRESSYHLREGVEAPYFFTRANIVGEVTESDQVNYMLEDTDLSKLADGIFGWIPTRVRDGLMSNEYNKWDRYATTEDAIEYLKVLHKGFKDNTFKANISSVNPEMDNRACASWDKHDLSHIPRNEGKTYSEMWKYNTENKEDVDIMYIVSWNDYTERHQIEPTLVDGYREIVTTQKYASLYKNVEYNEQALQLPMKLFELRKELHGLIEMGFETGIYQAALDQVAQNIVSENYLQAKLDLQGIASLLKGLKDQIIEESYTEVLRREEKEEDIYFFIPETIKGQLTLGRVKAYIKFEYEDRDDKYLSIHTNLGEEICSIKKSSSKQKKLGRVEVFVRLKEGLDYWKCSKQEQIDKIEMTLIVQKRVS